MQVHRLTLLAAALILPTLGMADDGVRIYGRVDIGPIYESNPTGESNFRIDEVSGNRLGFIGTETLSKDLWAFYRLEHRFHLDDGTERSGRHNGTQFWTDKAWVGIGSKTYGALSAGRILTVGNSIVGGGDTEAMTDSIGSTNSRKGRIENNLDNGLFYESPWIQPGKGMKLRVKAHYALAEVDGIQNPYGLGVQWRSGKFLLDTGYQHDVYKDGSDPSKEDRKSNSWFTGAGYDFDSFELKGTFATSRGYEGDVSDHSPYRMKTAQVSLNKDFGPWRLGVMIGRKTETSTSGTKQPNLDKVAVGYWYNFSKNTMLMPTIAYERKSGSAYKAGSNGFGEDKDKSGNLYLQLGLRHEF